MIRSVFICVGVACLFASIAAAADKPASKVTLKLAPSTLETKTFDPRKLPDPAPPIHPPEAACCVSDFDAKIQLSYNTEEQGPVAGLGQATGTITAIEATITLKFVIWLPKNASADLKAHEDGHRQITQRIYDAAEPGLRKLLEGYIGKTFDGRGADAMDKAATATGNEITKACINHLGGPSGRVNTIYDEITNHSMKKNPPAAKAIEQAFEQYAAEQKGK